MYNKIELIVTKQKGRSTKKYKMKVNYISSPLTWTSGNTYNCT